MKIDKIDAELLSSDPDLLAAQYVEAETLLKEAQDFVEECSTKPTRLLDPAAIMLKITEPGFRGNYLMGVAGCNRVLAVAGGG